MANDHYVQRALMKFWSRWLPAPATWDNEVWFFDFATKRLAKRSTRKLFAREGLNDDAVEARLGKLIENPLARFAHADMAHRAAKNPTDAQRKIDDPEVLRAVALAFVVQGARGLDGTGTTTNSLGTLMAMNDAVLSACADAFWSRHRVGTFAVPEEVSLFLPETGWYAFPTVDPKSGPVWGMALPLNPRTALFALPNGVDFDNTDTNVAFIANFSIGMGELNGRVVVSPASVDTHGVAALEASLPTLRMEIEEKRDQLAKIRALVEEAFGLIGLEPPPSRVGSLS